MANIRVKTNNNTTNVRVGQTNAVKVIASNSAAASNTIEEISDVNTTERSNNTVLLFNGTEYIHVSPSQIVDLADGVDDDSYDAGSF